MLGGIDYSNNLSGWLAHKPNDSQLIASWHNYQGQSPCGDTAACWTSEAGAVAAQVPVVTGEFGETDGGSTFLTAYMTWADANGIGYLPWAWWDSTGLSGDNALYALYTGPGFTPKAPAGTTYKAHLASLATAPSMPTFTALPAPMTFPQLAAGSSASSAASTPTAAPGLMPVIVSAAEISRLRVAAQRDLRVLAR